IAALAQRVVDTYYWQPNRPKGKGVTVSASASCFVPKPFTPFQWEPQDTMEQLEEKQQHLVSCVKTRKVSLSWHDARTSFMEAVLARGDRRLGKVLETLYRRGCHLDAWSEHFDFDLWIKTFADCGLDPAFYANRRRPYDEVFPWDHLDYGVSKAFLMRENKLAHESKTTPNCRQQCSGCGAGVWKEGVCVERNV
ncbi:MAG: B12-binding domain-containing radical SAM protein, partial [Clostridia bacterium]|nr:B12-binding domain-containing radical SAM protein [Clostridia bacterium]